MIQDLKEMYRDWHIVKDLEFYGMKMKYAIWVIPLWLLMSILNILWFVLIQFGIMGVN